MSTVACQGTAGAYSHIASGLFLKNPEITFTRTFEGVFDAVENGLCEYGVLPLENSNAGSVTAVYHLMKKYSFYITKSLKLPVSHCLLAKNNTALSSVTEIFTHEQAAAQCGVFIESLAGVKLNICENTAVAAKLVAKSDIQGYAAIASKECAAYYNLSIIKKGIENHKNNYTRFILISKDYVFKKTSDKISLLITLKHKPGALLECLKQFSTFNINLTKIESIPITGTDFEFMFYFDCEVENPNLNIENLITKLNETSLSVTFLGFYSQIQPSSI